MDQDSQRMLVIVSGAINIILGCWNLFIGVLWLVICIGVLPICVGIAQIVSGVVCLTGRNHATHLVVSITGLVTAIVTCNLLPAFVGVVPIALLAMANQEPREA